MGDAAIYPEDVIAHHRAFIDRRRAGRPGEEYRDLTAAEWDEFLAHFELRKVALGTCGRDFGTPCAHENACQMPSPPGHRNYKTCASSPPGPRARASTSACRTCVRPPGGTVQARDVPMTGLAVAPLGSAGAAIRSGTRTALRTRSQGRCRVPSSGRYAYPRRQTPAKASLAPAFDQASSGPHRRLSAWRSIASSSGSGPIARTSCAQRQATAILAAHSSASSREGTSMTVSPPMTSG
jgi:hypothetical protein